MEGATSSSGRGDESGPSATEGNVDQGYEDNKLNVWQEHALNYMPALGVYARDFPRPDESAKLPFECKLCVVVLRLLVADCWVLFWQV